MRSFKGEYHQVFAETKTIKQLNREDSKIVLMMLVEALLNHTFQKIPVHSLWSASYHRISTQEIPKLRYFKSYFHSLSCLNKPKSGVNFGAAPEEGQQMK